MRARITTEFNTFIYCDGKYNQRAWAHHKQLKQELTELKIGDFEGLQEKVYALIHGLEERPKCYCGQPTSFRGISRGFKQYCSISCANLSPEYQEKKRKTSLAKYGVEHHLQADEVKNKKKATNLEKYGVECNLSSTEFREKSQETCLEKYGVKSAASSTEVKNKIKQTFDEKYNGSHPKQSQQVKQTCAMNNVKHHGVVNVFQSKDIKDKIKKTNLEKYGVEHSSQRTDVKALRLNNFRGTQLIEKLLQLKIDYEIEPYQWGVEDYTNSEARYKFNHLECGNIFTDHFNNGRIPACPHCNKSRSKIEKKLANELSLVFPNLEISNRTLIAPYEIDIVIGTVGIEVNGVYWHSEAMDRIPIIKKSELCPIQLLHFWDYELVNKFSICKSIICAKANHFHTRIPARKTLIKRLSAKEARNFFDENHLQGYSNASYQIGLVIEGEIQMALTIGKSRFNKKVDLELHRLASKMGVQVIGGASKLFRQVERDFVGKKLITFADKRYSTGELYASLGFTQMADSEPNYSWVKNNSVFPRYKCQKHKLEKLLGDKFDPTLSEVKNMQNNGYNKVKDCGNKVFLKQL
jgi:hypothetical protein